MNRQNDINNDHFIDPNNPHDPFSQQNQPTNLAKPQASPSESNTTINRAHLEYFHDTMKALRAGKILSLDLSRLISAKDDITEGNNHDDEEYLQNALPSLTKAIHDPFAQQFIEQVREISSTEALKYWSNDRRDHELEELRYYLNKIEKKKLLLEKKL